MSMNASNLKHGPSITASSLRHEALAASENLGIGMPNALQLVKLERYTTIEEVERWVTA